MKEFNLEEAKAGKPVCTRNGLKARIICFDREGPSYPILALVRDPNGFEDIYSFTEHGRCAVKRGDGGNDLMMASEKHEGWINVYKNDGVFSGSVIYKTKEEAKKYADMSNIAIAKIEWEE